MHPCLFTVGYNLVQNWNIIHTVVDLPLKLKGLHASLIYKFRLLSVNY